MKEWSVTVTAAFFFFRMFVGTWNVGGRAPHAGLDLSDWLTDDGPDSSSPHIYVLGYVSVLLLLHGLYNGCAIINMYVYAQFL